MIDRPHIERQLEQARELEAKLLAESKPYLHHYLLASRIKRKLGKVRKMKREFEKVLAQGVDNSLASDMQNEV